MLKGKRNNEDGMSLVEIMLAVAIFVIGSASVIHLFVGSQLSLAYTIDKSQAMLLAREGIEEQREDRNKGNFDILSDVINETIIIGDKEFTRNVIVVEADSKATITSTVTWDLSDEEQEVSFTEVITNWK